MLADPRVDSATSFAQFLSGHHAEIVRIAFKFTHDLEEAKDIAQDTFLRAYRFRGRLQPHRDPKAWLFVIARRCAIDSLRRNRRLNSLLAKQHTPADIAPSPEQLVLEHHESLYVREVISGLSESYQTVIRLYYMRGLRYREIAAELHLPLGTVKTLMFRAKQQLKNDLELIRKTSAEALRVDSICSRLSRSEAPDDTLAAAFAHET